MIFFQFPDIPAVACVFSGREANVASRTERNALLRGLAGKGMVDMAECRQTHKDGIILEPVPRPYGANAGNLPEADGMMSSRPGLGLMIKTADCQPILLTDSAGAHIMALHVGWRGNRINFPATAIKTFCDQYRITPQEIWAVRGPSLGPASAEFVNFDSEWGPEFHDWYYPRSRTIDLWRLTRHQLEAAGVPAHQIYGTDICTYSNPDSWFSYRRDKSAGRQGSLIWIRTGGDGA